MRKLRKHGYYCVRKFGSKGHEDVVAFQNGQVLMIQCKWSRILDTKPSGYNLSGLIQLARKYGAYAVFAGMRKKRMYFQFYNHATEKWEDFELDKRIE